MAALVVLIAIAVVILGVLRWGADSRTGDDWRRPAGRHGNVGGPLR